MRLPNENAIRDNLIERLDIIEPGLILVDREHYLKNTKGASGFLDVFARAANDQLVIIEIKRTDAAAREALQELFKYAALLRQKYLVRHVDYRLIILSVEWHELLIPYSEFVKSARYEISAGAIILGANGLPIRVDPVTPIPTAAQRQFSIRHFFWRFADEMAAIAAVPLIAKHMQEAGLDDFVLIRSQSSDLRIIEKGFIYFAQQELSLAEYQRRIRAQLHDSEYEEYEEQMEDLVEEEDRIAESADQVWLSGCDDLFGRINSDISEISNPEKAAYWFAEGSQTSIVIERFGRFKDEGISDEVIIKELFGRSGTSDYHLDLTARTDSAPQIEELLAAIENIFYFNSEWRGVTRDLVAYAQRKRSATIRLIAFSNEDILRAIAGTAFKFPGYSPTFRFDIERTGEERERFIGLPEWDGTVPDFDSILKKYFDEEGVTYFIAHHFGENRSVNTDIMRDLGLRYTVFRDSDNGPERIRVQGSAIVVSPQSIKGSLLSLIDANVEEVDKIVTLFMSHDQEFKQNITDWVNNNG